MFAVFDLLSDANLVLDHNLSVRYANERAVSCLELESYGNPNGTLFQTFDPSGPKNVDTENCMENSELESGLCRWKTSSGRVREFMCQFVCSGIGLDREIIIVANAIPPKRRKFRNWSKERSTQSGLQRPGLGMVLLKHDGQIVQVNKAFSEILGSNLRSLKSVNYSTFFTRAISTFYKRR